MRNANRTRRLALAAVAALALPLALTAGPAAAGSTPGPTTDARVDIVPVAPGATEVADVDLSANPGGLGYTASGTGSGFNPLSQYVSLGYGVNSVPVQTGNIPPCADDGTLGDPNTSTLRMFIGAWLPVLGSNRVLAGVQPTTTLDQINTVSIRRANVPVLPQPGDIRPQVFQIRSCGQVVDRVS
ncbi:hypothetical protein [Jannaschia sp. R86511]|uniref:hypothetical protein n=1 Tax=Jannaschia sp. R86511 TaxID=3093853 RepID=UPI0036D24D01